MNAAARSANGFFFEGVMFSWTSATTVTYRITSSTGTLGNGTKTNLSQGSVTFFIVTETLQ
jgi:hypothetical protein